jgi:hypothetical protein
MKYIKIYEEFSVGKEKYMIVDKNEKIVLSYINNFNKKGDKMMALFSDIDLIDPTEPKMLFDSMDDAKFALDSISKSNFYRMFDVDGGGDSLVSWYVVETPGNASYRREAKVITQEEFDTFMSNLKIEKVFVGLFSGDINI